METLLHIALSNAVTATLLALVVALVGCLCRRPAVMHALWLIVLLRLLMPPFYALDISWPDFHGPAALDRDVSRPLLEAKPRLPLELHWVAGPVADGAPETAVSWPAAHGDGAALGTRALRNENTRDPAGLDWRRLAVSIWLGGSVAWFAIVGLRVYRFSRLLRYARPARRAHQEQARRVAQRLGLTRCPGLWLAPAPVSPMVCALVGRPRLLMPAGLWERLTAEQRETLLAHELAHVRRRDHWTRRLELLVLGLYWWHPVAWWARQALQDVEETCCDAWVVWALPDSAAAYAEALVTTVAFLSRRRAALPAGASGMSHVRFLKRRVSMILQGTTPRALSRGGLAILLAVGALLLMVLPRAAQAQPPAPAPAQSKPAAEPKQTTPANSAQPLDQARADVKQLELDVQAHRADVAAAEAHVKQAHAQLEAAQSRLRQAQARVQELEGKKPATATLKWNVELQPYTLKQGKLSLEGKPYITPQFIELPATSYQNDLRFFQLYQPKPKPAAKPSPEQRLAELEKKLNALVKEAEALRRELQPQKPGSK